MDAATEHDWVMENLMTEGLFESCSMSGRRNTRFTPWDLPPDAAMAKIEDAYVTHFDDP